MKTSSLLHALAALPIGNISLYQTKKWSGVTCRQRVQHCPAEHRSTFFQPVMSYQLYFSCALLNNPADIEDFIWLNDTTFKDW
jgi:hypothetical protein